MSGAKVNWYGEKVKLVVKGATAQILTQAAMICADKAAIRITENDQIDTGFMRAATYGVGPKESGRPKAESEAPSLAERPLAPEPGRPDENTAAIHCAAEYAIYQDMKKPFMYPAAQDVAKEFKGIVERNKVG
jgi:hypothetical protein